MHGPGEGAFRIPCSNAFSDPLNLALDPIVSSLMPWLDLLAPNHTQHIGGGSLCNLTPAQHRADLAMEAPPPAGNAIACVSILPQPSFLSHYGDVDLNLIDERWAKGCAGDDFSSWWLGGGGGAIFDEDVSGTPLRLMPAFVDIDGVKCVCFCDGCSGSEWSSQNCVPEKLATRLVNAVVCKVNNRTFLDVHVNQSRQKHHLPASTPPMATATGESPSLQGDSDSDSTHHRDPGPAVFSASVDRGDPVAIGRLPKAEPKLGHRKKAPPSVLIIEVDSVSRAHAARFLPKTIMALRRLHPFHTHTEFSQFATVAANSIPNQMALLGGCFRNGAEYVHVNFFLTIWASPGVFPILAVFHLGCTRICD